MKSFAALLLCLSAGCCTMTRTQQRTETLTPFRPRPPKTEPIEDLGTPEIHWKAFPDQS